MLKIGLTGNFGTGKTTVAAMFKARGARVIDADALGHAVLRHDAACIRAIGRKFGRELITPRGVDRVKLGKIVFADPAALKDLEKIVHPGLGRLIRKELAGAEAKNKPVVLDAAVLIETGWHKFMDAVIVVKARRAVQVRRAMARTGLSRAEVLQRIRRQMPLGKKIEYAAHVIDNSGSAAATEKHVERIFRSLTNPIRQEKHHDQRTQE